MFLRISVRDLGPNRHRLAHGRAVVAAQMRSCATTLPAQAGDDARVQLAGAVLAFESVIEAKTLAPRYARVAADLERLRLADPDLRIIRAGTRTVARELASLRGTDPDFCGFLRRWKAAGWRFSLLRSFDHDPYAALGLEVDQQKLDRAFRHAINAQRGLQRRGVDIDVAVEIASTLLLPPS